MNTEQPSLTEAVLLGVMLAVPGGLFAWLFAALIQQMR